MKCLSIIFLGLCFIQAAHSKCGSAIEVFPKSKSIDSEGHIIIQAYGWGKAHELLDLLDSKYPVYLNSIHGKTKLLKRDYSRGKKSWSQVLLIPESKLEVGITYTLVIEKLLPEDQDILNVNRLYRNGEHSKSFWTVEETNEKKGKNLELKLRSSNVKEYGCGPSVETCFAIGSDQKDEMILLVDIVEIESGLTSKFYVVTNRKEIRIGHNMCSGPYTFRKDYSYKIRFNPNYISGVDENEEWIDCPNPWDE